MTHEIADIVVVGSGAAGAAAAGELARLGADVLLIEAGAPRFDAFGTHARNLFWQERNISGFANEILTQMVFSDGSREGAAPFEGLKVSYGAGGMFSLWTSHTPDPHDEELPACGTPAEWREALGRARHLLHVNADPYAGGQRMGRLLNTLRQAFPDYPGARQIGPMPVAVTRQNGQDHYVSADDLMYVGDARPVRVRTGLRVRALKHGKDRVEAVLATDAEGRTVTIDCGAVILAAGVVGNPAILAASQMDTGPALGRYIFEHPCIGSRVALRPEILEGVSDEDALFSIWLPYGSDHRWQNQVCRYPYAASPLPREVAPERTADIFSFVAQDVSEDNRLTFDLQKADAFGMQRLGGQFSLSRADKARIGQALAEHTEIAASIGDVGAGWSAALYATGASTHMMGSTRMGDKDDGESVCDPVGRLWRYDNIYLAGNSVLPTSNAGNPTIVTVASALRTADALASTKAIAHS